jgi:hypothetical protein
VQGLKPGALQLHGLTSTDFNLYSPTTSFASTKCGGGGGGDDDVREKACGRGGGLSGNFDVLLASPPLG